MAMKQRLAAVARAARQQGLDRPTATSAERAEERIARMTSLQQRARLHELMTKHVSYTLGRKATAAEVSAWIASDDYVATLARWRRSCGSREVTS